MRVVAVLQGRLLRPIARLGLGGLWLVLTALALYAANTAKLLSELCASRDALPAL